MSENKIKNTNPNEVIKSTDIADESVARRESAMALKRKKLIKKRIISGVIAASILGGCAFGAFIFFGKKEPEKTIWSQPVMRGSINSSVTGNGEVKALKSATLTLPAGGTVQEVYIQEGQYVNEGDLLYKVDSTEAQKAVNEAQKTLSGFQTQIDAINRSLADLTFRAPFSGTLIDAPNLKKGANISQCEKLGRLVDSSSMKLSLYFSYAYENDFYIGKPAIISVPSTMTTVSGTVETINKVHKVSPEGSVLFEVIFTMQNPGTLTDEMGATASIQASDGSNIFAYEAGKLVYKNSVELLTKAGGELTTVNLVNYSYVPAGTVLVQMKGDDSKDQMASINTSMSAAREALEKAQADLAKCTAVSPISGTVLSCNITAGQPAAPDVPAVSIADTSVMVVEAKVDGMSISYVEQGMSCDIVQNTMDGERTTTTGTVVSVSLEGKNENGVSYFPATIQVENPDGALRSGMLVEYTMTASQVDDCLKVPLQAIKQSQLGTCVFVESETAPENALDSNELGLEIPKGYYAVPVTIGVSDQTDVEVKEGLEEDQIVFIQYMTEEGSSFDTGGFIADGGFAMG